MKREHKVMVRPCWRQSLLVLLCAATTLGPLAVRAQTASAAPVDTPAIAARIVQLTNQTRAQNGVGPAQAIDYLALAAVGHSKEMLELNYFSHTSPTPALAQPKMRIQQAWGWDTRIGENIYRAQGISADVLADHAMAAWLKSPSHLKNLIDPTFNSVGIGIYPKGDEFAITQMFSNQTIVIRKLMASAGSGGYDMVFQGQVREGSKEGALFINNGFKETFTADANGLFELRASAPAGSQVSISQKKSGTNSYAQNLAFPIEAGLAR